MLIERPDYAGPLRSAPDYLARPKAAPISSGAAVKLSRSKLAPYRSRGSDDQILGCAASLVKRLAKPGGRPSVCTGMLDSHPPNNGLPLAIACDVSCFLLCTLKIPLNHVSVSARLTLRPRVPFEISRFAHTPGRLLLRRPRRLQT